MSGIDFHQLKLIGTSECFVNTLMLVERLAPLDAPVLIQGETGTGKENVARAMHYLSGSADAPFVPVNCGAIPDSLFESEMFGYRKGAYTDAKQGQMGLAELAAQGTLFLDEVDSLSSKAQAGLLRFLQSREYRPLGARETKICRARILAASNADLPGKASRGEFRSDLLFRLNVLSITIPPLRDRPGDVALIARHLLHHYSQQYDTEIKKLHTDSIAALTQHLWPGNVRELENLTLREFFLSTEREVLIRPDNAACRNAGTVISHREWPDAFADAKAMAIEQFEIDYLNKLMKKASGNVTAAAKLAGKERRALGKLIKKHKIDKQLCS